MTLIRVTPLDELPDVLAESDDPWLATFCAPGSEHERPKGVGGHAVFAFNDITAPRDGLIEPSREMINAYVDFLIAWDRKSDLVLQCWMGVSRSSAAAAIALAWCGMPPEKAAPNLRDAAPFCTPNALMIAHADDLLGLSGKLSQAISGIGRGTTVDRGTPFTLPVPR